MTLTINLPTDLEQMLLAQAAKSGQDVGDFVLQAVKEKIAKAGRFDEICGPFALAVEASGVSEEEFDSFFEEAREAIWREKQSRP